MKIVIASDHGGFALKEAIREKLIKVGYEVVDKGTNSDASVDYPEFAFDVAKDVGGGKAERGVLCC